MCAAEPDTAPSTWVALCLAMRLRRRGVVRLVHRSRCRMARVVLNERFS
jgi:hypothetical protein